MNDEVFNVKRDLLHLKVYKTQLMIYSHPIINLYLSLNKLFPRYMYIGGTIFKHAKIGELHTENFKMIGTRYIFLTKLLCFDK